MDSANSGSLHTSDEEYDSRAADSFLPNTHQPLHPPPPPPLFDPLSNYTHLHQNPNSLLLNPNISWSGPIRPDPNPSTSHNPMLSPPPFQTPAVGYDTHHHQLGGSAAARNPKKRSRASRRAPTTVLTTDVTNFRAMVQEFTGIPAQPFNNSSFFGMRSAASEAAPPYVRRTFAPMTNTSNLFTVQNPLINSLLQSNPKFIFSKPDNQFHQIPSKSGSLQEFGDVNAFISPDQHVSENDDTKEKWRNEGGINGGYVEKRGGEGAVESWIIN